MKAIRSRLLRLKVKEHPKETYLNRSMLLETSVVTALSAAESLSLTSPLPLRGRCSVHSSSHLNKDKIRKTTNCCRHVNLSSTCHLVINVLGLLVAVVHVHQLLTNVVLHPERFEAC